ncbi:MAG: RnfABCDGE type electron transport complex subunit D [Treponemataceae bacterium]|nr:RnfABCDGE type electron transport complex subunit D [Treponemataceae bacterium]
MGTNRKFYHTVSTGPYRRFSKSATSYMVCFWAALCPQILTLAATKSYSSLAIILCTVIGALLSEFQEFLEGGRSAFSAAYALLAGTLIGFYFPAGFPPVAALLLTFVMMFSAKCVFGRQGISWLNPVAFTLAGAWFVGHFYFPGFLISKTELVLKNPSLFLVDGLPSRIPIDDGITDFLNAAVFDKFGATVPGGFVSLLWDAQCAIPAFRFNALTLLASIFLIAFDIEGGLVPCVFLASYSLLVRFLSPVLLGGVPFSGDIALALFSGGTIFTAFFLLQWQGTLPRSLAGKIIYAVLGGCVAFAFCGTGTSPIGSAMTALFLNIISPAILFYEDSSRRKKIAALLEKEVAR